MKSWLSKPKHIAIITAIGFMFFVIVIPLVINGLYQLKGPIVTEWDCSDALLFYGAVLGATGTIILGIVSVYQNKKTHELNERVEASNRALQKLNEANFVSLVSLDNCEINERSSGQSNYRNGKYEIKETIDLTNKELMSSQWYSCFHIDCQIKNTSDYPIVQIDYQTDIISWLHGLCNINRQPIYIESHNSAWIRFIVPKTVFEENNSYSFTMQIFFTNVFDYPCKARISIDDMRKGNLAKISFRIAKYSDVKPENITIDGQE